MKSLNEKKLLVKIANSSEEIEGALKLRYSIFNIELGKNIPATKDTLKDQDVYDEFCDHLIVKDELSNSIVGTYRILRKQRAKENIGFYTEREFHLNAIYDSPFESAEVGRSCVHQDYRDGSVISLLWAGIGSYVKKFNLRYLFGCGSIHSTDALLASKIYFYFQSKNLLSDELKNISPKFDFTLPLFNPNYKTDNLDEIKKSIPPLIKGYIRIGSKFPGFPALDEEFRTIDFFVLFDIFKLTEKYQKFYTETEI